MAKVKDLTHYFNSPKEEETACKTGVVETDSINNGKPVEDKAPVAKKRKLSLSKSKMKSDKMKLTTNESVPGKNNKETKSEELLVVNSKKRKRQQENNIDTKIIQNVQSSKLTVSKCEYKYNDDKVINEEEKLSTKEDSMATNKNINLSIKDEVLLPCECGNSSDRRLAIKKVKRSVNKNLFLESDDKTSLEEKKSPQLSKSATEKSQKDEKSPNSSKNSLFSYFNKVDKAIALEKKSEKIKVEALVHAPPNETQKPARLSVGKSSLSGNKSKKNKNKNKILLENSDIIEVISSENIVDENSSVGVNVQISPKNEQKEETINQSIDTVNAVKWKPNKLASIFIPKKTEKPNVPVNINSCSQNNEDKTSCVVEEQEKTPCDKQEKILYTRKKSNKKFNDVKLNEKSNNVKQDNSIVKIKNVSPDELNSTQTNETNNQKNKTEESGENKISNSLNGFVKMSVLSKKKPLVKNDSLSRSHNSLEKRGKTVDSPRADTNIVCFNKTPDKKLVQNENQTDNKEITPKQKHITLNGYFTPKNDNKYSEKKNFSDKKSPSPWVMKVRFNRTIKPLSDSEDDSKDSVQDIQEEKSTSQNAPGDKIEENKVTSKDEGIDSTSNVVADNKISSENIQATKIKRKSLRINAANTKRKLLEEKTKSEDQVVLVIDDDDTSSENSQESRTRRKSSISMKKVKLKTTEEKSNPGSSKPPVKMWPFFQKGGARQSKEPPVDEAKLKAKMLFLESGVPEVIKRKVETEKNETVLGWPAPFPTVSHVTQADVGSDNVSKVTLLPRLRSTSPPLSTPTWSSILSLKDTEEADIPVFQRPVNVKAFLQKLQEEEPKTEVKVMYKKLKEYKNKANTDVWTDRYKPKKSADMVGNSESIKKLKTWLETLKNRRKREGSVSSGDEFVNDDSDEESSAFNNMALINGPYGCGKTSSVYAIANELECKVLEINASCNRSGKRILAEFSESMQSHQVERAQPINGFFNHQNTDNPKKKKKKSKISPESKSEKTSLILVEDADILFTDTDDGFMQALSSLAATAKRPLILVTNQTRNPHLDRFLNKRLLQLTFSRPKASKLGLWLRLVGLVEGVMMTADQVRRLVEWGNCDVRRCLLQLQLMVHGNNSGIDEKMTAAQLWWCWPSVYHLEYELPTLLEPEQLGIPSEIDKKIIIKQLQNIADTTSRLAYMDMMSAHTRLGHCEDDDPCPVSWRVSCRDSTSLSECQEMSCHNYGTETTTHNLATWLAQTITKDLENHVKRSGQNAHEARWMSILRQGEGFFMSGISTTMHSSHQSVSCDYLPMLRDLGRAEQVRLANYTRRANRFFNYLQGLGINANKSYRDFMCDTFS